MGDTDNNRLPVISGVLPLHGSKAFGTKMDDLMHPRTYSGDSGYRSRTSSKESKTVRSDHELQNEPSPLCQGAGDRQRYVRRYTKSKQSASVGDDINLIYGKAMGAGLQGIGADRHTEVPMNLRDHTSTVPRRRFHGDGIVKRIISGRVDSGYISSTSTLAFEPDGNDNAKGSLGLIHDPLKTNPSHGHRSDFRLGRRSVNDRCPVGVEDAPAGRSAGSCTLTQTDRLTFQDPRCSIGNYNQGRCKSAPSLMTADSLKWESQTAVASHDQSKPSLTAMSELDIRSYGQTGDDGQSSEYHRIDSSVRADSARPRTRSFQSALSLVPEKVQVEVNLDNLPNALSLSPRTAATLRRSSLPDVPLDKLFIRRILSLAGHCIPSPVAGMSEKECDLGTYQSAESAEDADRTTLEPLPDVEQRCPDSDVKSEPVSPVSSAKLEKENFLTPVCPVSSANLEKADFLKAFDRVYREARLRGINTVGRVIQISNFAGAMLDRQGGYLSIDALDVHLYVPFGALPDGPPELVYIYVEGNQRSGRDQLTPCVHCGPSTLRFRKDVFLTFPHCAKDASKYHFTFTKSKSGGYNREVLDGEDGVMYVDNHSITMTMDHFCGYSACALVPTKMMSVCVFINEDVIAGQASIRLRVFDDIKCNLTEVEESESKHDFFLADPVQTMEIERTGDVKGTLMLLSKSWEITEPACGQQEIHPSVLWRATRPGIAQNTMSKLFHVYRPCQQREPFRARMKVIQDGSTHDSLEFLVKMPRRATLRQDKPRSYEELFQSMNVYLANPETIRNEPAMPLTEGIYHWLCEKLDVDVPVDWRHLPEKLPGLKDHGIRLIRSISARAKRESRSPTGLVLDAFFAESMKLRKSKADTLRDLRQGLLSLNRQDLQFAISDVDDELGSCEGAGVTASCDANNNNNKGRDQCSVMTKQVQSKDSGLSGFISTDESELTLKYGNG